MCDKQIKQVETCCVSLLIAVKNFKRACCVSGVTDTYKASIEECVTGLKDSLRHGEEEILIVSLWNLLFLFHERVRCYQVFILPTGCS